MAAPATEARRWASRETHPREWAIFNTIDTSGDGKVDLKELQVMCEKMGASDQAEKLANILDEDNDGQISFEDFCTHFGAVKELRSLTRLRSWRECIGLGVAGNVAGHMAQAGEADPVDPGAAAAAATPAAIFAFYLPHPSDVQEPGDEAQNSHALERLERFPVTNAVIDYPHVAGSDKVQVEPEIALLANIVYDSDGRTVKSLVPLQIAAFNDCSIRQLEGSTKLSEKKNWGFGSKGISLASFSVESFEPGTLVDHLVLVSYIKRGGQIVQYSQTAPARSYLMFHQPLLDWIVLQMNTQQDTGKWENIANMLALAKYPTKAWIALGAGEYTTWGEENFLQPGDETVVMVYDERSFPAGVGPSMDVVEALFQDKEPPLGVVALHQTLV